MTFCKKKKTKKEFATLYRLFNDHKDEFFKYFQMSRFQFNILYLKIKNHITKENTQFREIQLAYLFLVDIISFEKFRANFMIKFRKNYTG